MNNENNKEIERLNAELKKIVLEINELKENNGNPKEIKELEDYAEEIKENIKELSSHSELDYELFGKTLMFKATANALLFRICKRSELDQLVLDLEQMGVPKKILTADEEKFCKFLKSINCSDIAKYQRYHEFIRVKCSKGFQKSLTRKKTIL